MNKKKILVTGGAGYIGSHTVVELVKNGYEPIIVDNYSNSHRDVIDRIEEIIGFKPVVYDVDCRGPAVFEEVFRSESDLAGAIHFAAFKAVSESVDQPVKYYKNNIGSLLNLIELMQTYEVENLIFSSSCTVYGIPETIQVTEETPLQPPNSPYGNTKLISEQIIRDSKMKSVLLRYFNPIGAHDSAKIGELPLGVPNNLIPFITQTAIGIRKKLTVFGDDYDTEDGSCIRDFIHVCDLAEAHVKALDYLSSSNKTLSVFNLGTGKGKTVLEVVRSFERVTGKKLNYEIGPRRAGDVPAIFANAEKAADILKWRTKHSLDDALKSAWEWQKKL